MDERAHRRRSIRPFFAAGLLVATGALAMCASPAAPADEAAPTATASGVDITGALLFTRAGGQYGDETVFVIDATSERRLTEDGAACCARVSPDGTTVLLLPNAQPAGPLTSATIPIEGGEPTYLERTDPEVNLVAQTWSPDGTRIASEGWVDRDPSTRGVYTAAYPDGGDLVQVTTNTTGGHDIPADYSPDGSQIVFYRSMPEPGWDMGGTLWVVDVDGGSARQLETGDVAPSWWARWSPDGEKILFATGRNQGQGAVWTVEADGGNLTELYRAEGDGFPITPEWSPDGSQIVFALDPGADEFIHPDNTVIVMNADGSEPTTLIAESPFKRRFDWFAPRS